MSLCWFCDERETSSEASMKVKMKFSGSHSEAYRHKDKEQTIQIPRCAVCKQKHNREKIYNILAFAVSLGLSILAGNYAAKVIPVAKTFLGIVIGIIVFFFLIIGYVIQSVKLTKSKKKNIKILNDHPLIKDMRDKGWELYGSAGITQEIVPKDVKTHILQLLQKANEHSLQGTSKIMGVAILYESSDYLSSMDNYKLASMLIRQYQNSGFIPKNLSLEHNTPILARQLVQGKEISPTAGLDTKGSNNALAVMLIDVLDPKEMKSASALSLRGNSVATGQTFLAIVAK